LERVGTFKQLDPVDSSKVVESGGMAKNRKPPAAGKGRVKGKPNKVTGTVREMFAAFVESNAPKVQVMFDRVAKKDPAKALEILTRFAEFVLPRLQRTELRLPSTPVPTDRPITDIHEATEIYRRVMGDPTLDIAQIQFAPQAPRQAALEPLDAPISTPPVDAMFTEVPADPPPSEPADNVVQLTDRQKLWTKLGQ
jgi:hypothetical protein